MVTNRDKPFTVSCINWIRFKHQIPMCVKNPEELSVKQVAEKFNVSNGVVRYWIGRKFINARRIGLKFWISLNPEQELELKKRVESSSKIAAARLKSQKQIEGGVL